MTSTIMFIHGAWLTRDSWADVAAEFESHGYATQTPAWPHMDRPVAELRQSPAPELSSLGVNELVNHHAALIKAMDEPPILIGHSFGGLVVQKLLDRGLGAAGIAIDPVPPRGVLPGRIALRTALPVLLTWQGWKRLHTMSEKAFNTTFGNELPPDQQRQVFQELIVPAPGRLFWQAALGLAIGVNYRNPERAPLLLIAGEKDRTIEPDMVRSAYKKHRRSPAATDLFEFAGRGHLLMLQPGWEEITRKIRDWLGSVITPAEASLEDTLDPGVYMAAPADQIADAP